MKKILASTAIVLSLAATAPAHAWGFDDDCWDLISCEDHASGEVEALQAALADMTMHKDNWKEMALSHGGILWSERYEYQVEFFELQLENAEAAIAAGEELEEALAAMTELKDMWYGNAVSPNGALWREWSEFWESKHNTVNADLIDMTQHKDNWKAMAQEAQALAAEWQDAATYDNGSLWSDRFDNVVEQNAELVEIKEIWRGRALASDGQLERDHKEAWKAIALEAQAIADGSAIEELEEAHAEEVADIQAQLEEAQADADLGWVNWQFFKGKFETAQAQVNELTAQIEATDAANAEAIADLTAQLEEAQADADLGWVNWQHFKNKFETAQAGLDAANATIAEQQALIEELQSQLED